MVSQTSLEAYRGVDKTRRQREVMAVFEAHRGFALSNRDVAKRLGWEINRVTPRVLELRRLGFLEAAGVQVAENNRRECVWRKT